MQVGDRIKLLRLAEGLTQQYIGDLLDLSQKSIALIESGKMKLDDDQLDVLANYFIVSRKWLEFGIGPLIEKGWGYTALPFKSWAGLSKPEKGRWLSQLSFTIENSFPEFLQESKIKEYYLADIEDSFNVLVVIPLGEQSSAIFRVSLKLLPALQAAFEANDVLLAKRIVVSKDLAKNIHQSSSPATKLADTVELHRLLGLESITKSWKAFQRSEKPRSLKRYQNRVLKVCRDILGQNLDPLDIIDALRDMTAARIGYEYKDSIDYLESRNKTPLKSHLAKMAEEDSED